MFLCIEDAAEEPSAPPLDEDLNIKLASSVDKIHELQAQLQESELNFFHLQEQYTILQAAKTELESIIAQSNENETDFLRLHAQYSESEDRYKILQEENERLSVENEYKLKELALRATEISTLRESLNVAKHSSSSDTIASAKVDILEQKLKHVTGELEKEISNSTQLAIDKIKLQSYIQRMEMQSNQPNAPIKAVTPNITIRSMENNRNLLNSQPVAVVPQDVEGRKLDSSSILVHTFPSNEIKGTLEETVFSIAAKMNIMLTKDDIKNVRILNGSFRRLPNNITLYIQFKTDDMKMKFLANRDILRKDVACAKVSIKEFIDGKVHTLFTYANKKLRGVVFGHIVCTNNTIIAKKYRDDSNVITIHSTEQVDELLKTHLLPKNEPSVYLQEDKIDECYYKI